MSQLFREIVDRTRAGERVAFCTVVATKGSTPQGAGAKMLVLQGGRTLGTLGGGCVEAEVRREAHTILNGTEPKTFRFSLDRDYGWDDGLICGGMMDIHVQPLGAGAIETFQHLADSVAHQRTDVLEFTYALADQSPRKYREEIGPPPVLVIAGAGHVGQALAKLAVDLDFRVDVIDDRADHLSPERFPTVRRRLIGPIEPQLREYPIDTNTYAVIVTRGHRNDGDALAAVVRSPARYVGLIGSKRKIKQIFDDLSSTGVPREMIHHVHAPIGLEIGAVTVTEIAVSIAAELIAVRRNQTPGTVHAMQMAPAEIDRWLDRNNSTKKGFEVGHSGTL